MDIKTILEQENHEVDIELLGHPFRITPERNVYNAIRNKYKKLALEAKKKFTDIDSQFTDIDDLLDNAPDAYIVSVEDALLEVVRDIISVDIYVVDKDTVINQAFEGTYFDEFSEAFNAIYSRYDKIMTELSNEHYAREQRRRNRPRWQSATIGGNAINAWSNQLDTAAMNAAEGAAHAVANAIGNAISNSNAKRALKNLFATKSLRQNMIDSVYDSCFNLHMLLIDILQKYSEFRFDGVISDIDIQKAQAMFNNLTSINLSEEKRDIFINDIFQLNPYQRDFYKVLIQMYGDKDQSFGIFSDFFGMNVYEVKNEILSEFVQENLGETEEDAHICQRKMEERAMEIGLDVCQISQAQELINEQLEKLDLIYRTVDGIVFETRDEADIAKKELVQIQEIMKTIQPPTKNSLLSYETYLLKKQDEISAFTTEVKTKYLKTIQNYLYDFDRKFRKASIISSGVTREQAGREKALQYVRSLPVRNYQELDSAKQLLINFLPEVGITMAQAVESVEYLNDCENRLNTVDNITFPTREEAEYARNELTQILEIMSPVKPPNANSLLDYEKSLFELQKTLEKFTSPVKQKYIGIIQGYLRDFDNQFRRVGFTQLETREQAAIERALAYVRSLSPMSYEELKKADNALHEFVPRVGITYEQATSSIEYLRQCYLKLNTVDGIVFQTKDEADYGRSELQNILAIMNQVQPPKSDSLLSYERNLFDVKEQLGQFTTPIKNKYIEQIDKYLLKFDELFKQVGLLKKVETRQEAAQIKALKLVKSVAGANCSYADIDKAMQMLQELLPEIGINIEQAHDATEYLQSQENRLNTVDGVVLSSRDEAKLAHDELAQIQNIMSKISPPTNEPLLSYERNLLIYQQEIAQFITDVKNKYLGIIQKYLSDFDEKFRRISLIKIAETREEAARERALRFVKAQTYNTLADVEKVKTELVNQLLPELGISTDQANGAVDYLLSVEKKLNGESSGSKFSGFMNRFKKM